MTAAATERELLDTLDGTFTLEELYAAVERADLTGRADGEAIIHGRTDTRWKRRVRNTLQSLKGQGRARRAGDGVWVIDGRPDAPRRAVLVSLTGERGDVELRHQAAHRLLRDLDEPADLIFTDTPYALGVGRGAAEDTGARVYARDSSRVVGGYVDVDPAEFRDFTSRWVQAAAEALRPGGQLAVVTGPQQAAWVQVAAEDAGLTYVNSITARKVFALRTMSRFAHAHWTITVMCRGRLDSPRRVFNVPPGLPKARSGADYPLDVWDVGRTDAKPGELRYPNSLPEDLVTFGLDAWTRPVGETDAPDHVVDPFTGGGTIPLMAALRGLRVTAGDVNRHALAFTARRISARLAPAARPCPVRVARPVPAPAGQLALI